MTLYPGPLVQVTAPADLACLQRALELLSAEYRRSSVTLPENAARLLREVRTAREALAGDALERLAEHTGTSGIPQEGASATLTTDEVAKALGCTPRNVRALARRESIPSISRRRRGYRFDPVDIDEYLRKRG